MKISYGNIIDNVFLTLYSVILGIYFSETSKLASDSSQGFLNDKSFMLAFIYYVILLIANAMLAQGIRNATQNSSVKDVKIEIIIALGMIFSIFGMGVEFYTIPSKFYYLAFFAVFLFVWQMVSLCAKFLEKSR
ncbi:hypothetical protein [Fusibacter bizertensis]